MIIRRDVGIIAEDDSDVASIRALMLKIKPESKKCGIKKRLGGGHGKIVNKCGKWSIELYNSGCSTLIIVHDADFCSNEKIKSNILSNLSKYCPFKDYVISVPVQELEAWLLSDPKAIKIAMNLKSEPKIGNAVETINSPKEYLGKVILKHSRNELVYLNTKHNEKIAEKISINEILKKCPSFISFHNFIRDKVN